MTLSLEDKAIAHLPPEKRDFWSHFNKIMRSRPMLDVFLKHLEKEITARFRKPLREIPCHPTVRLGRDADGYKILPHPDSADRVYTAQVYLADDDSQEDIEAIVYRKLRDGSFEKVRKFPFLPNTAFCFARTDETWHGVEAVTLKKPRQNLHISCFMSDKGF